MKPAYHNRLAAMLAVFALVTGLASSANAAWTSASTQPPDWPERWAAAHAVVQGGSPLAAARSSVAAMPDWPERWAAAHPGGSGLALASHVASVD